MKPNPRIPRRARAEREFRAGDVLAFSGTKSYTPQKEQGRNSKPSQKLEIDAPQSNWATPLSRHGSATLRKLSQFPPFANSAKNGAPSIFLTPPKIKAQATRPVDFVAWLSIAIYVKDEALKCGVQFPEGTLLIRPLRSGVQLTREIAPSGRHLVAEIINF